MILPSMILGLGCLLASHDRATIPYLASQQPVHESALNHGPAIDGVRHPFQLAAIYIPGEKDIMLHALNLLFLDAFDTASPDEMRL